MKRIVLYIVCTLCVVGVCQAQRVMRTLINMEKLQRSGEVLQAMDSATYVLSIEPENTIAKNFVHSHWDKTMKQTTERLNRLSDEQDLKQAKERITILLQLDNIHTNLHAVPMPLHGPNDKWVWQPDISYYTGSYDNERSRVYDMVLAKAMRALRSDDIEQAREYYEYAFDVLLLEEELPSNKRAIVQDVNAYLAELAISTNIYERIAAYNITELSLWLDDTQTDISALRKQLQQDIAKMYLEAADAALAEGDTLMEYNYRLSAQDWE